MLFPSFVHMISNDKNFKKILVFIITIGHLVAFVSQGATFWVDGIIYLDMAHYMIVANLAQFYSPIMTCIASHFPLLPPLIWALLYPIFTNFTWIIFAVVQHIIAGLGLYYLILALRKYLDKIPLLVATIALVCYPFYQAFHNMVMTESLASSFLIIMVAASLFIVSNHKNIQLHRAVFACAVFLGIQSRPQIALFAIGLILFQFLVLRNKLWNYCLLVLLVVLSYFTFPLLRWILTGKYFNPSIACLSVRTSLMSQVGQPNSKAAEIISKYDFPGDVTPSQVLVEGLTYEQSLSWNKYLISKGMSEHEANQYMQKIANEIRWSSYSGIASQIDSALSGIGMLNVSIFHNKNDVISEGMTKKYWNNHYTDHYNWLSWNTEADHTSIFYDFIGRFTVVGWYSQNSIDMMATTMNPYISKSLFGRDLFSLSKIPTDFFTFFWMIGIIIFITKKQGLIAASLGLPVIINYLIVFYVGFGNIRYFYLASPFVVITATLVVYSMIMRMVMRFLSYRKTMIN